MVSVAYKTRTLILANIQKTIYSWVRTQVNGLIEPGSIIWRNQSEPLPPRPCVTMKITDGPSRTGYQDNMVYIGGTDGTQYNVGGQRTMKVSFQVYGNTKIHRPMAYQLAVDLNSSLSLQTVLDQLRAGGISVLTQGEPLNITALEETEYEERAQFDVMFGLAQNVVDDPGVIEHVGPIGSTIEPA